MTVTPIAAPPSQAAATAPAGSAGTAELFAGLLGGPSSPGPGSALPALPTPVGSDAPDDEVDPGDGLAGTDAALSPAQIMAAAHLVPIAPVLAKAPPVAVAAPVLDSHPLTGTTDASHAAPAGLNGREPRRPRRAWR